MIHTDGRPTICAPTPIPRVELPDDPRVTAHIIEHTLRIVADEIAPHIASGKLSTPEEVLGVILSIQAQYAAERN